MNKGSHWHPQSTCTFWHFIGPSVWALLDLAYLCVLARPQLVQEEATGHSEVVQQALAQAQSVGLTQVSRAVVAQELACRGSRQATCQLMWVQVVQTTLQHTRAVSNSSI